MRISISGNEEIAPIAHTARSHPERKANLEMLRKRPSEMGKKVSFTDVVIQDYFAGRILAFDRAGASRLIHCSCLAASYFCRRDCRGLRS